MSTSRPFRYDWLAAQQRIEEAGENPASFCLVCLPIAGIHLLYALFERARWEATYRIPGFDYDAYREEIQNIVDDTEVGLMAGCDEILTQITTTITNTINQQTIYLETIEGACCYLEDNPVNEPPPTELPPTGGDTAELCKAAQKAHDNGSQWLQEVFDLAEAGGGLSAGVISALLAAAALSLPFALLGVVIGAIVAIVADFSTDGVIEDWADMKEDVVCAIYTAATASEAKSNVHAAIDNNIPTGLVNQFFKYIYNQAQLNRIWNGDVGDTTGYVSSYCDGCGQEPFEGPVGLSLTVQSFSQPFADTRLSSVGSSVYVWANTTLEVARGTNTFPRTYSRGSAVINDCRVSTVEHGDFNTPAQYTDPYFHLRLTNSSASNHPCIVVVDIDATSDLLGNTCVPVLSLDVISADSGIQVSQNTITFDHPGTPGLQMNIIFGVNVAG